VYCINRLAIATVLPTTNIIAVIYNNFTLADNIIMLNNVARATTCGLLFAVPSPEVSLSVSGSLYAGNRVIISCNIHVAASVVSEVRVVAVWKMEGVQLTNSSRINISEAVLSDGITLFVSNVTINPVEVADSGDYTCEATLISHAAGNVSTHSTTNTVDIQGEILEPEYYFRIFRIIWYPIIIMTTTSCIIYIP